MNVPDDEFNQDYPLEPSEFLWRKQINSIWNVPTLIGLHGEQIADIARDVWGLDPAELEELKEDNPFRY